MNPFSVPIEQIAREQNVNCKKIYDTLVIYGDLKLENEKRIIEFSTPKLWVRGDVVINNCANIHSLPVGEIEANNISISKVPKIKTWPKKIISDTVMLRHVGSSDSVGVMEIYTADLNSDCVHHNPDPASIYGLRMLPQPNGSMVEVIDAKQNVIWRAYPADLLQLHESGHLKDIHDTRCVQSLLQDIDLIPAGSRIYKIEDARDAWHSMDKNKLKGVTFGAV